MKTYLVLLNQYNIQIQCKNNKNKLNDRFQNASLLCMPSNVDIEAHKYGNIGLTTTIINAFYIAVTVIFIHTCFKPFETSQR